MVETDPNALKMAKRLTKNPSLQNMTRDLGNLSPTRTPGLQRSREAGMGAGPA